MGGVGTKTGKHSNSIIHKKQLLLTDMWVVNAVPGTSKRYKIFKQLIHKVPLPYFIGDKTVRRVRSPA